MRDHSSRISSVKRRLAMLCGVLALATVPQSGSRAAVVATFTDSAVYSEAVGASHIQTENFSGAAAGLTPIPNNTVFDVGLFSVFYRTAGGVNEPTNRINGTADRLDLQWDRGLNIPGNTNTSPAQRTLTIQLIFDTPILAFGADFGQASGAFALDNGNNFTLSFNGGSVNVDTLLGNPGAVGDDESGFVGFISSTRFDTITITSVPPFAIDSFTIDNVAIAVNLTGAEPSTLVLGAGMAALLASTSRRRGRKANTERETS